MFKIENKVIKVTRGDSGIINFSIPTEDGLHTFSVGDIVRFKVFKKKDCGCVEIQKDTEVTEAVTNIDIILTKEDTKIGDLISKPVDYWYEIELNPDTEPQTVVCYDDDGEKIFRLYPEGDDK